MSNLTRVSGSSGSRKEDAKYDKRGSFAYGCTLTNNNQVVLHSDGLYYKYLPVITTSLTVSAGSSPSYQWESVGDGSLFKLTNDNDLISELNSRAGLFNRQAIEMCRIAPPSVMPSTSIGYNQAIFIDSVSREVYTTYDPSTGVKYIKRSNMRNGAEVSSVAITDTRVGHLDSLHVDVNTQTAIVTGTQSSPALLKINVATGAVVDTYTLSLAHSSDVLVAVDSSVPDNFIVWGKFGGSSLVKIYRGSFSKMLGGAVLIWDTGIEYPQGTILQGLSLLNNRVYALCGEGGVGDKQLIEWRLSGEQQASTVIRPEATYAAAYGGVYEPEGLHVISERHYESNSVNMYMGWTFGDGTKAGSFCSVFKYAAIMSRQAFTVDGYAGRPTGTLGFQMKELLIRLRRNTTGWEVESGEFLSMLTSNTIKNLAVAGDGLSITFDLNKPYQDVLGWSINASPELTRFGRAIPVWGFKAGGDSSHIGHTIRFSGIDSATYVGVNTAQEGVRISLILKVII